MIRLGQAEDGRLILGSSEPFPADIHHVEYYRQERLFNLVLEGEEEENILMPCEIPPESAAIVHQSPSVIVIAMLENGQDPYGYAVPLIQIGI